MWVSRGSETPEQEQRCRGSSPDTPSARRFTSSLQGLVHRYLFHSANDDFRNILQLFHQWVASMIGVVAVGLTAFAALAMVKKDEKFEREVLLVVDLRQ